jgi:hypothetical protein
MPANPLDLMGQPIAHLTDHREMGIATTRAPSQR